MFLPTLNAYLNGASAVFLAAGYGFIRRKHVAAHRACMLAAFASSCVFLTSYLIHHARHGSTRFVGTGWLRPVYFVILSTHTFLAAAIVPMALTTLFRAWQGRFDLHARLGRRTLPIWMYVSVTGIVIYLLLYARRTP
jgi:putative membrane protein